MRRIPLAFLAATAILMWTPASLLAQTEGETLFGNELFESFEAFPSWEIEADAVTAYHDLDVVELSGNVVLRQGEDYLRADFARYYQTTGWIYLQGNVNAQWLGDALFAEEAEFDLRNLEGRLIGGELFYEDTNLYISGERMEKTGPDTYFLRKARVTSCDREPAAWSIQADEANITLDDYAELEDATFRIRGVPVAYSPYLFLSTLVTRQTGFLDPTFGSSSRLGAFYNQPWYWAIDEEQDLTLYAQGMTKRGAMPGFEYRHAPNAHTQGFWRFDYLYDSIRDADADEEDDRFDEDSLFRPNQSRWWIRSKYNGFFVDPRWEVKLDLDLVSDQNYLREFEEGPSGFDHSRDVFLEYFGRDIDDIDAVARTSNLLIERSFDYAGVALRADYTHNTAFFNDNIDRDLNNTPQRLPELDAFVYKQAVPHTPFEFTMDAGLAYFHRNFAERGGRFDARPELSAPFDLGPVHFIPFAGFRETIYMYDENGNATVAQQDDGLLTRHLPDFGVNAFTELFRIYSLDSGEADAQPFTASNATAGKSRWSTIRHALQPRLGYRRTLNVDQEEHPFFDDVDRIDNEEAVTWELSTFLERKRERVVPTGITDDSAPAYALDSDVLEFLRLRLEQSYDFVEADRSSQTDEFERRPFSDLEAELRVTPDNWISLGSRTFFSPYEAGVTRHEHDIRLTWPDRFTFRYAFDFQESLNEFKRQNIDKTSIMLFDLETYFLRRWTLGLTYRTDLENSTDLEKSVRLRYNHQCYSIGLGFSAEPGEERFEIKVDLLGVNL